MANEATQQFRQPMCLSETIGNQPLVLHIYSIKTASYV